MFFAAIIGFLLGISVGSASKTTLKKKLGAYVEAQGIRLLSRDGTELPVSDLLAAADKR